MIVTVPYDPMWEALTWAKENCPSYITNDIHPSGSIFFDRKKVDYYFGDEKEAVMFLLRWA